LRFDRGNGRNGKELDYGQAWTQRSLLDYVRLILLGLCCFLCWRRKTYLNHDDSGIAKMIALDDFKTIKNKYNDPNTWAIVVSG
jgi:hypothetical protein